MQRKISDYIEKLDNILNFSDLCWWIIDLKNDPLHYYCNDLMKDFFTLDKNQEKYSILDTCPIAGDYAKNISYVSKKEANLVINEFKELLSQKRKEYNNTFPYFDSKNNEIKYYSSRAKILEFDENNKPFIIYGTIKDITSKTLKEKKLDQYYKIINKYVMICIIDTEGIIIDASDYFCKFTGFEKNSLLGNKYTFLKYEDMDINVYEPIWEALKTKQTWNGELQNKKADGTPFWIKTIITPNLDTNDNVKSFTAICQDITDKKTIERLSTKDKLTNVNNRGKLDSILENELNRASRYKLNLSIILLDIDYFKSINDRFGHITGDEILKKVAQILESNTRSADFVGRWGGEEFLIICPNSNLLESSLVAQKIKDCLENYDFKIDTIITSSFGISTYRKNDDITTIINRADKALYRAKENGRNRIEISQ